jgi:hypothetical protein
MQKRYSLVVLGMHRSGTSMLTGLLNQVGVRMGKRLYAPQQGVNEKGFWEHEDIVDTHDELLLALNSQWDDLLPLPELWWEGEVAKSYIGKLTKFVERDFGNAPVWGIKDPRMCRLLPLWLQIFKAQKISPAFVFMTRNPFEVVASLQKRDKFTEEKALILWLSHTLLAERYSRGQVRAFIDFNQVVNDPTETLIKIERQLHVDFPISVANAKQQISAFIAPDLRHHQMNGGKERNDALPDLATRMHGLLSSLAEGRSVDPDGFDLVAEQFSRYQKGWNIELVEQIQYLNKERANYRRKFFQIYRSWSWLVVKPFWIIERFIRGY